jgi:hypothetical protein
VATNKKNTASRSILLSCWFKICIILMALKNLKIKKLLYLILSFEILVLPIIIIIYVVYV